MTMSQSLNQCQFIGNLGADPETRETPNGMTVATLSLACSWKGKDGKEGTEWIRIVAFGKLAEIMREYLHKGDKAYVSGRMTTRKWQDQQGNDKYTTEIVADQMIMLGGKGGDRPQSSQPAPQRQPQGGFQQDQDVPFSSHERGWIV